MSDPLEFVRANTRLMRPPLVPELILHMASEIVPIWHKTEEELAAEGVPPPFWAFAWAGGQALARYVLDHPKIVKGLRVLDFASGSGLAGIAAMKAGAASVVACEIDAFAIAAIELNARVNEVEIERVHEDIVGRDDGWDIVLAGDICYERDMSQRVFGWLKQLFARGATVYIGDPKRNYLPKTDLSEVAAYDVQTTRELEDQDVRRTKVWMVSGWRLYQG